MSYSKLRAIRDYTPLIKWTWGDASEPDKAARSQPSKSSASESVQRDSKVEGGNVPSFPSSVEDFKTCDIYGTSQGDTSTNSGETIISTQPYDCQLSPRIPSLEEYLATLEARANTSLKCQKDPMRSVSTLLNEVDDLLSKALSRPVRSHKPEPHSEGASEVPSCFDSDSSISTSPSTTRSPSPISFSYSQHPLSPGFCYEEGHDFVRAPLAECPDYED